MRHKKLRYTVVSFISKFQTTVFFKELMRYLQKYTNTVTGFAFCILTCSVFQCFHDGQRIGDRIVALDTLDIDDCTYTAVIMFKGGRIQPFRDFPVSQFALAFLASLAAFLAVSTREAKAVASAMASSDRALRFISMPACFRPYMNQL